MLAAFATAPELTPWAIAVAMIFSGAGGGSSPDQTLAVADVPDLSVYRDAYAIGMIAVAVLIAVAFAIGVLDLGSRGRRRSALGGAPAENEG